LETITNLFSGSSSSSASSSKKSHHSSFLLRFYSHLDRASATSTYTEGEFEDQWSPDKALTLGSGYWCSAGQHKPSEVVSYVGDLKHRKKLSGIKISWAYAPGSVQVRVTPDGEHWTTVVGMHPSPRAEITYEQNLLFDKQRNVKGVSIDMTNPRQWGYYGINQIALMR
jgi:F5/8 type C domain.